MLEGGLASRTIVRTGITRRAAASSLTPRVRAVKFLACTPAGPMTAAAFPATVLNAQRCGQRNAATGTAALDGGPLVMSGRRLGFARMRRGGPKRGAGPARPASCQLAVRERFEIGGVEPETIRRYSSRAAQIEISSRAPDRVLSDLSAGRLTGGAVKCAIGVRSRLLTASRSLIMTDRDAETAPGRRRDLAG